MRRVTDGMIGVVARADFRIEVWKSGSCPKTKGACAKGDYFFLTKINYNGEIGDRSIGMSKEDLTELLEILNEIAGE